MLMPSLWLALGRASGLKNSTLTVIRSLLWRSLPDVKQPWKIGQLNKTNNNTTAAAADAVDDDDNDD